MIVVCLKFTLWPRVEESCLQHDVLDQTAKKPSLTPPLQGISIAQVSTSKIELHLVPNNLSQNSNFIERILLFPYKLYFTQLIYLTG